MTRRPRIVVFDVIDTVFRIDALGPALAAHGHDAGDAETLYAGMLRDAMALSLSGSHAPLPEVMAGALMQLRAKRGLSPSDAAREAVANAMRELPPHDDAESCFPLLKDAGFRIHALSNGAKSATEGLIARAGFADLFDGVHSVERARRYKPNRSAYMGAVEEMRAEPGEVMLVATHAWDCHGAKQIGIATGFVRRGQDWPAHLTRRTSRRRRSRASRGRSRRSSRYSAASLCGGASSASMKPPVWRAQSRA